MDYAKEEGSWLGYDTLRFEASIVDLVASSYL